MAGDWKQREGASRAAAFSCPVALLFHSIRVKSMGIRQQVCFKGEWLTIQERAVIMP